MNELNNPKPNGRIDVSHRYGKNIQLRLRWEKKCGGENKQKTLDLMISTIHNVCCRMQDEVIIQEKIVKVVKSTIRKIFVGCRQAMLQMIILLSFHFSQSAL